MSPLTHRVMRMTRHRTCASADPLGYPARVALQSCPFCRALFPKGEVSECPECGVHLVSMDKLPPSVEALHEEMAAGEIVLPEQRDLPTTYFGRGRGLLLVLAILGLISFFLPW